MAADLASAPVAGLRVQLCGDAHLLNFGGFATPERNLVFDVNDFDETIPGPFEWDVARLVASVAVAGRWLGADAATAERAARRAARAYCHAMAEYAEQTVLDVWYARIDAAEVAATMRHLPPTAMTKLAHKARSHTSARLLPRLADLTAEGGRIRHQPPLVVSLPQRHVRRRRHRADGDLPRRACATPWWDWSTGCRSPTSPTRSSASAASAPAASSSSSSAATSTEPVFLQVKEAGDVGAGAVRRGQRVRAPGPARRRGAAGDPGRQRRLPRVGLRRRPPRLRPPAARHEAVGRPDPPRPARRSTTTPGSAAGPSPGPTPAPATPSPSPPTSTTATSSPARWGRSPIRYVDVTTADHAALEAAVADGTIVADRPLTRIATTDAGRGFHPASGGDRRAHGHRPGDRAVSRQLTCRDRGVPRPRQVVRRRRRSCATSTWRSRPARSSA